MNVLLAIPAKGQNKYIEEMVSAIDAMSVKPFHVLYMADRPSPAERIEALKLIGKSSLVEYYPISSKPSYVGRPQMVVGADWFLTGNVRNQAVAYIEAHPEIDAVVFIDGDCIPETDLIKAHMEQLDRPDPCVSVGQRKEAMYSWQDQRMTAESDCHIFKEVPTEVDSEGMFVDSGVVWTCNFGMNRAALASLKQLNNTLYGRAETFFSDFLGTWGGEDGFIGLECFYTKIPVIALGQGDNGIRHKMHLRDESKYNHVAFINYLEEQRERLMYLLDLHKLNARHYKYIRREQLIVKGYDYKQA